MRKKISEGRRDSETESETICESETPDLINRNFKAPQDRSPEGAGVVIQVIILL
jgi:hypothetical protein